MYIPNINSFSAVPPVNIDISLSYTDTLYSGTPLNISCDIELPALVDIPVLVSNQWTTTDNANIPSADDTTITASITSSSNLEHTATLSFYPLNVTNSGGYQCNIVITANDVTGNHFVDPHIIVDNTSIVVEGNVFDKLSTTSQAGSHLAVSSKTVLDYSTWCVLTEYQYHSVCFQFHEYKFCWKHMENSSLILHTTQNYIIYTAYANTAITFLGHLLLLHVK